MEGCSVKEWKEPTKPTAERGEEWIRTDMEKSPRSFLTRLPRSWHYYAAWALMVLMLIGFLTGAAISLIHNGRVIIQHYVEKIEYGIDNDVEK